MEYNSNNIFLIRLTLNRCVHLLLYNYKYNLFITKSHETTIKKMVIHLFFHIIFIILFYDIFFYVIRVKVKFILFTFFLFLIVNNCREEKDEESVTRVKCVYIHIQVACPLRNQ